MEKIIEHPFDGTVWSVGYWGEAHEPKLWIEVRKPMKIEWFTYDFEQNSVQIINVIEPLQHPMTWFKGIQNIGVFLQMKSGKNPGIEAVIGIDLRNGQQIYKVDTDHWIESKGSFLNIGQWLNIETGKFEIPGDEIRAEHEVGQTAHFEESQVGFTEFQQFFGQIFNEKIVKGLDYFEGTDKLIFSYYLYDNGLKNLLKVCDHAFNVLFVEEIAQVEGIGFNTFQLFRNKLIYVKNKHQLVIYEL